jgi:signal peptidase II
MKPKYKAFFITLILALAADQGSKMWARSSLKPRSGAISVIDGYWEFRYAENTGAAFSFFRNSPYSSYIFAAVAAVAFGVIVYYMRKARPDARLLAAGMGLLAGGALGNLIDRVAFGRVTDFVVWRVGSHVWPTFNVADAVLLIGVLGLMILPKTAQ